MPELRVDRQVLDGFREGERRAFEAVMRAYLGTVRTVVSRFFSGQFAQEEAMQEVWTHAYRQRQALDPDRYDQVAAWLAVLARRKCIDLLRQQGRQPDLADQQPEAQAEPGPGRPDAHTLAEWSELQAAVDAFVSRLKPQWQSFFRLHFVQGHGFDVVSPGLGISRTRCKYMKRVLIGRAKRNRGLMAALGRVATEVNDAHES